MSECEVTKVNAPKLDANPQLIVLTLEEAKTLLECACCVDAYTFAKCKNLFDRLTKRIQLVEKSNE